MTANSSSPLKSDPSRSTAPETSDSCNAHTRLHITPLDQDLLKVVLPASVLPQARNISLHTLETFPEKRYGYVDLPEADAEKLRKRLNGTTFKGVKMRIEKARPMPVHEPEDADAAAAADARKERKKRKAEEARDGNSKRRRDLNVVEGVLLKDRKVKRGWTESTDSKVRSKRSKDKHADKGQDKDKDKEKEKHKTKRLKSKYTDQDECLLKTRLPPNVAANLPASEAHKKKRTKNKSLARQVTVHEFERTTTFPSFLKHVVPERKGKEPVEFVQGKGWVDEDGALVEAVQCKDRREDVRGESTKKKEKENKGKKQKKEIVESNSDDEDDTSSSGTSSDEDEDEDEDKDKDRDAEMSVTDTSPTDSAIASPQKETRPLRKDPVPASTRPSSSSSSSSASSSASSTSDEDDDDDDTPEDQPQPQQEQEQDQEHQTNLTLDIPATKTPHPLEALYKRDITTTTTTPAQAPTPFSFFAHDPEDSPDSPDSPEPHTAAAPAPTTPYTRQDLEYRNLRSAAPTPDTANPARRRAFWAPDHDQDEDYGEYYNEEDEGEEEEEGGEEGGAGKGKGDAQRGEAGDFQSWFWQNRRDLNQAWMNRRKTAAKERRHRENKARASKAI
ncbi:hypothetical protein E4U19_004291 [Claviceps sp. Clav32 group G5]|nr:hypothetical protein E4U19_004291 [Claviceps sp. Clav32 group G5]